MSPDRDDISSVAATIGSEPDEQPFSDLESVSTESAIDGSACDELLLSDQTSLTLSAVAPLRFPFPVTKLRLLNHSYAHRVTLIPSPRVFISPVAFKAVVSPPPSDIQPLSGVCGIDNFFFDSHIRDILAPDDQLPFTSFCDLSIELQEMILKEVFANPIRPEFAKDGNEVIRQGVYGHDPFYSIKLYGLEYQNVFAPALVSRSMYQIAKRCLEQNRPFFTVATEHGSKLKSTLTRFSIPVISDHDVGGLQSFSAMSIQVEEPQYQHAGWDSKKSCRKGRLRWAMHIQDMRSFCFAVLKYRLDPMVFRMYDEPGDKLTAYIVAATFTDTAPGAKEHHFSITKPENQLSLIREMCVLKRVGPVLFRGISHKTFLKLRSMAAQFTADVSNDIIDMTEYHLRDAVRARELGNLELALTRFRSVLEWYDSSTCSILQRGTWPQAITDRIRGIRHDAWVGMFQAAMAMGQWDISMYYDHLDMSDCLEQRYRDAGEYGQKLLRFATAQYEDYKYLKRLSDENMTRALSGQKIVYMEVPKHKSTRFELCKGSEELTPETMDKLFPGTKFVYVEIATNPLIQEVTRGFDILESYKWLTSF